MSEDRKELTRFVVTVALIDWEKKRIPYKLVRNALQSYMANAVINDVDILPPVVQRGWLCDAVKGSENIEKSATPVAIISFAKVLEKTEHVEGEDVKDPVNSFAGTLKNALFSRLHRYGEDTRTIYPRFLHVDAEDRRFTFTR